MHQAKLIIDESEINVLWFTYGFYQGSDATGRPTQKPAFIGLKLIIEARSDSNLADWSFAPNQTKQLELRLAPVHLGGKTRKLYFYDCHLVNWINDFWSTGEQPMTERLSITAAGVKSSNVTEEYSAYWRKTYFAEDPLTLPPAVNPEEEEEPKIIDFYTTNKQGERITKYKIDETICVNIESVSKIGDEVEINLKDKTKDFKFQGVLLENDTMTHLITSSHDSVELEVVKQN